MGSLSCALVTVQSHPDATQQSACIITAHKITAVENLRRIEAATPVKVCSSAMCRSKSV